MMLKLTSMLSLLIIGCMTCVLSIVQEVLRIKSEHPNDSHCIVNDRVKGRLKVTRAFGAGFLKQVCDLYDFLILIPLTAAVLYLS